MDEEVSKPKIHDPQAVVRKFEDDRREARQADTKVMNLRHIKELDEKIVKLEAAIGVLEFRLDEYDLYFKMKDDAKPAAKKKAKG